MSSSDSNKYKGLWRASAHEAVAYQEDFPECLLVLPELIDGSVSHGRATKIRIHIDLPAVGAPKGTRGRLQHSDNGNGFRDESHKKRFRSWTSDDSLNMHHRYGHGSKKCMTKWMPDYEKGVLGGLRPVQKVQWNAWQVRRSDGTLSGRGDKLQTQRRHDEIDAVRNVIRHAV